MTGKGFRITKFFYGIGQILNGLVIVATCGFFDLEIHRWINDHIHKIKWTIKHAQYRREHANTTFRIDPLGGRYKRRGHVIGGEGDAVFVMPNTDKWLDGLPFIVMEFGRRHYTCDERGWVWPSAESIQKSNLDIVAAATE